MPKKSSFFGAPNLTFLIFTRGAVQQVKATNWKAWYFVLSGVVYSLLAILNLLSPENQLCSKNKKSKILHPEKEYFFSVFLGLMIVSWRMIRHEDDMKLERFELGCNVLSNKNLRQRKKIIAHKKQRITRLYYRLRKDKKINWTKDNKESEEEDRRNVEEMNPDLSGNIQHRIKKRMAGMARPKESPDPCPLPPQGHAYAGTCFTSGANKRVGHRPTLQKNPRLTAGAISVVVAI